MPACHVPFTARKQWRVAQRKGVNTRRKGYLSISIDRRDRMVYRLISGTVISILLDRPSVQDAFLLQPLLGSPTSFHGSAVTRDARMLGQRRSDTSVIPDKFHVATNCRVPLLRAVLFWFCFRDEQPFRFVSQKLSSNLYLMFCMRQKGYLDCRSVKAYRPFALVVFFTEK